MSADAPLSYFYSRAANPLRRCAPAPPKGELFSSCRSAFAGAGPVQQPFCNFLSRMQETAPLIRIINRRLLVFFTGSTNYFFSA